MKRSEFKRKPGAKGLTSDPSKALKRTPLKRGDTPLKQGDMPLKVDRAKVQAFKKRAVENSNRRAPLSEATKAAAYERTEGCCVMCGSGSWIDPHHILAVQHWPELEEEPDNVIPLCRGCHDAHERHAVKVPLSKLPPGFARFLVNRPDRQVHMEKHYVQS